MGRILTVAAVAALPLAGCGSAPTAELPPVPTPAASPPLRAEPAGEVIPLPGTPAELAVDTRSGLVRVRLAKPDRVLVVDPDTGRVVRRERPRRHLQLRERAGDARLDARARTLTVRGESIDAGVGPTGVVADGRDLVWVVDTAGNAVLQAHRTPRLEITRRTRVPGHPYGVAFDPERIHVWVTQPALNRVTQLDGRAGIRTRASYPAVRGATAVAVDPGTGRVFVAGTGALQVLDPRRTR